MRTRILTLGVTQRHSREYFVDCKGIFTPILHTWVRKSTLLLQNRGHAEVLKNDPFFREIRNEGAPPVPECPPPPGTNPQLERDNVSCIFVPAYTRTA